MTFQHFFRTATGHDPYPYQCRLACGSQAEGQPEEEWLRGRIPCPSLMLDIPTGLGKTAAVVLAWLWNRLGGAAPNAHPHTGKWPRRLVLCLPMRTLVEQTQHSVGTWLTNLKNSTLPGELDPNALTELIWLAGDAQVGKEAHSPIVLLGGHDLDSTRADWDLYPEAPAILIGTQDMLLSRALNRGYGVSRYRWPVHFALLNNDCLWVHDETQLMGVGLETSSQLAGFRECFGTRMSTRHWWTSATLDASRLTTPEAPPIPPRHNLDPSENQLAPIRTRREAIKRLRRADTSFDSDKRRHAATLAKEVRSLHVHGTLTLVILNTVERAQELSRCLANDSAGPAPLLLHGRFRPAERRTAIARLMEPSGDRIVVSTQVVEAGVDISARTLLTELAPWASLVQRFGRCHRHGEMVPEGADIRWIDLPNDAAAPYDPEELDAARQRLANLTGASPAELAEVPPPAIPPPPRHIIRPKDLRDLFDTTPDIAGADLDVSRFIREGDERDAAIFWRSSPPSEDPVAPARDELCPVPVNALEDLAGKQRGRSVWVWDPLAREWMRPDRFVPGRQYRLDAALGGYTPDLGFDPSAKTPVQPLPASQRSDDAHDDEPGTALPIAVSLADHTTATARCVAEMGTALGLSDREIAVLTTTSLWHDVGKTHPIFQAGIAAVNPNLDPDVVWAKSGTTGRLRFERPRFRHELASALAFRAHRGLGEPDAHLVAYLIAAHHGKVRLSLRALPDEEPIQDDRLFSRGILDGDPMPELIVNGTRHPAIALSLAPMQLGLGPDGTPSWTEACLALRDSQDMGPFRLAFLEAVFRAADQRASVAVDCSL